MPKRNVLHNNISPRVLKSIEARPRKGRDGGGRDYAARRVSASSRIGDRLESGRKVYTRFRIGREFHTKRKPYIETQTQWPRQVGRGAVLAARARVRETATPVRVPCACVCARVRARRAERVGARVTAAHVDRYVYLPLPRVLHKLGAWLSAP